MSECNAQISIGMQLGATDNYLNTSINNLPSTVIKSHLGYKIGIPILYKISSTILIEGCPSLIQKNYSINRTDSLEGIVTQYNNTYTQLGVICHFVYGRQLQVFGGAGYYVAYWLTGTLKGKVPDIFSVSTNGTTQNENFRLASFNEKYSFNPQRDNRFEMGWLATCGLEYHCIDPYTLFLKCSYSQSLTDQQKSYMINQIPQYNQTFSFSVGVLYSLKQKHNEYM